MLELLSTYKIFFIPVLVLLSAQFLKIIIEAVNGNFSWKNFNKYGGMPSSHSAFVVSLLVVMGYLEGINSSAFSIAFVLATLTIRDATGLRHYLSNHSKVINLLIKKLPDKEELNFPHIEERLDHTKTQVLGGIIFSIIISFILLKIL